MEVETSLISFFLIWMSQMKMKTKQTVMAKFTVLLGFFLFHFDVPLFDEKLFLLVTIHNISLSDSNHKIAENKWI